MIRTINRNVETVDNPNIDYKYFNHVNWKGIDDSKNYLNIDQETFEDCKNVYIDEEGLLKSRPCIKHNTVDFAGTGRQILKSWKFNNYICFLAYVPGPKVYVLEIHVNDEYYSVTSSIEPTLMYFDNKVFIFKNNGIFYCDYDGIKDAQDLLYVPTKYIYTNNIKSENEVESDNLLTTSHKLIYNYTNIDFIVNPTFVNETVTLIVDGEKYVREWVPGLEKVLFTYKTDVPQNVLYNGDYNIDIADNGNLLMSSVIVTTNEDNTTSKNWTITFSTNGKYFEYVLSPNFEFFGRPIISRDGLLAVVMGEDGPYAYSLVTDLPTDPTGKRFPVWTNLLSYHGVYNDVYDSGKIIINRNSENNNCVNGIFYNFNKFIYAYGYDTDTDNLFENYYKHLRAIYYDNGIVNTLNYDEVLGFIGMYNIEPKISISGNALYILVKRSTDSSILYGYIKSVNSYSDNLLLKYTYTNLYPIDIANIEYNAILLLLRRNDTDDLLLYEYHYNSSSKYIKSLTGITGKIIHNDVISNEYFYQKSDNYQSSIKLLDDEIDKVVTAENFIYLVSNNKLYGNVIGDDLITVERTITGDVNPITIDKHCELNEQFISINDELHISNTKFDDNDNKLLYFPKLNKQKFNNKITGLHPVSSSQVAIFFENEIWYCDWTENGYEYHKSKLSTGLTDGSDVITSFDGSNIIFPSKRGLVYLGYQELVQSTDQTLTLLSNQIDTRYEKFSDKPIKLFLHKYWLITYNYGNEFYIFDIRNNSWWKWECSNNILNILLIDNKLLLTLDIASRNLYELTKDGTYEDVYNEDNVKQIDWYIRSQKLNFGTLNYHKNIVSIAINNVEQNEYTEEVSYNLDIKNYRLKISNRYNESQNLVYKVNMLRTFVKRCNSRKVNEFQYTLSSDTGINGSFKQIPLSIHSIIIKYTIAGQVR